MADHEILKQTYLLLKEVINDKSCWHIIIKNLKIFYYIHLNGYLVLIRSCHRIQYMKIEYMELIWREEKMCLILMKDTNFSIRVRIALMAVALSLPDI